MGGTQRVSVRVMQLRNTEGACVCVCVCLGGIHGSFARQPSPPVSYPRPARRVTCAPETAAPTLQVWSALRRGEDERGYVRRQCCGTCM